MVYNEMIGCGVVDLFYSSVEYFHIILHLMKQYSALMFWLLEFCIYIQSMAQYLVDILLWGILTKYF